MKKDIFVEYLKKRGQSEEEIKNALEVVQNFEDFLNVLGYDIDNINEIIVKNYLKKLVDTSKDDLFRIISLARYGYITGNDILYIAMLVQLDGSEVMDNLYHKLENLSGKEAVKIIFTDIHLPTTGTSNTVRAQLMQTIIERLKEMTTEEFRKELLSDCLRDLPDELYKHDKELYMQTGNIENYLDLKQKEFIEEMYDLRKNNKLFFGQKITDEVIVFLEASPEITRGKLSGNKLRIVKIPFRTDEWLKEKNPDKKRYYVCHCPWARESLLSENHIPKVSEEFCHCSAGFVKKPFEQIFGRKLKANIIRSALKGDEFCEFEIELL